MVPPGEEHNTLEHQLAKWAIENSIALDDTVLTARTFMQSIIDMSDDDLKAMPVDQLIALQKRLKNLSRMVTNRSSSQGLSVVF
jgi:hypothetical protein